MAWTAPATATTGQIVTAAFWNAQVKDNMLETAAATAAAAGDLIYADAANSMGTRLVHPGNARILVSAATAALAWRLPAMDDNYADGSITQTDNDTVYVGSWGAVSAQAFPSVTVTTGVAALVVYGCQAADNGTAGAVVHISYSISGATTQAAADGQAVTHESGAAGDLGGVSRADIPVLTAGSNTFQLAAKVSAGNGTILRPWIAVVPF